MEKESKEESKEEPKEDTNKPKEIEKTEPSSTFGSLQSMNRSSHNPTGGGFR